MQNSLSLVEFSDILPFVEFSFYLYSLNVILVFKIFDLTLLTITQLCRGNLCLHLDNRCTQKMQLDSPHSLVGARGP